MIATTIATFLAKQHLNDLVLMSWCHAHMQKFSSNMTPPTLYLEATAKHYAQYDTWLVQGPHYYGDGNDLEELAEHAALTAGAQFRQLPDEGHIQELIGFGEARTALPTMNCTEHGVVVLVPDSVVAQLSEPCVTVHPFSHGDTHLMAYTCAPRGVHPRVVGYVKICHEIRDITFWPV